MELINIYSVPIANLAQVLMFLHTPLYLVSLQLCGSVQFYSHFPDIQIEIQKNEKACLSHEDKAWNRDFFYFIILNWVKPLCLYMIMDKLKLCSDISFLMGRQTGNSVLCDLCFFFPFQNDLLFFLKLNVYLVQRIYQ